MSELRDRIVARTGALASLADPADGDALLALLRTLYAVGREDLPLGRLFEGHVDAMQIVSRYGSEQQRAALAASVERGATLGVWNAELSGEPLQLSGHSLSGGKSFASGAGILSHALVTVDAAAGRQLILLDLSRTLPDIDRSFWAVVGMQRSETHVVRWQDATIGEDDLIGQPGDYVREPWFSGGALRFAAVQAGGIAALVDGVRDHLVATSRAADPHQAGRLAALYALADAAAGAVRRAGEGWFDDADARLALVAAARAAVYDAGGRALALTQEAVGAQALFVGHPLAARITDLAMYLRQPGPDAQRMAVGAAVAAGVLSPRL
ncbi:acyl-CoA dehydrogenase [Sphingomonas sp. RS2018]